MEVFDRAKTTQKAAVSIISFEIRQAWLKAIIRLRIVLFLWLQN